MIHQLHYDAIVHFHIGMCIFEERYGIRYFIRKSMLKTLHSYKHVVSFYDLHLYPHCVSSSKRLGQMKGQLYHKERFEVSLK